MFRKSHYALNRYKAGREGTTVEQQELADAARPRVTIQGTSARIGPGILRYLKLGFLAAAVVVLVVLLVPAKTVPVRLTYEIDLGDADSGTLVMTLIAEGDLPEHLDLEFPPGVFGDEGNGVNPHAPTAHEVDEEGRLVRPLAVTPTPDGWRLGTQGSERAGFIYQVDLSGIIPLEGDVRRHISKPVNGGLRAAGFEVFLQPAGVEVEEITVTIHNPKQMPVIVPWPALVRNGAVARTQTLARTTMQAAHLSSGQTYQSRRDQGVQAARQGKRPGRDAAAKAAPVPTNLLYHPRDLADLNNSLLICGDLATASIQARDCVIQLATDRTWDFDLPDALELVRSIARTEMGFFGDAPTSQITVMLAANDISTQDGFDTYGVHTGSSVLVMMDTGTTLGDLEQHVSSVIAHEMFHGWLGEAIPQHDLDMLWFTEGATTWYAARMLTTARVWTEEHAQATLRSRIERDYTGSDFFGEMPVATAAKGIMASPDQVRFGYAGGMNAVMALDQYLAQTSGKRRPLDGVLRTLYRSRNGEPLTRAGFVETIRAMTGVDCDAWLTEHVYGKSTLPAVDSVL